jgi:hypothetical protein
MGWEGGGGGGKGKRAKGRSEKVKKRKGRKGGDVYREKQSVGIPVASHSLFI